jgi:hypothetical protein
MEAVSAGTADVRRRGTQIPVRYQLSKELSLDFPSFHLTILMTILVVFVGGICMTGLVFLVRIATGAKDENFYRFARLFFIFVLVPVLAGLLSYLFNFNPFGIFKTGVSLLRLFSI